VRPETKKLVLLTLAAWVLHVLYTLSPIDLLPDFIPVLGWVDDAFATLVAALLTAYTGRQVWRDSNAVPPERRLVDRSTVPSYPPLSLEEIEALGSGAP
jgi:uncharacterized membrane protein YkvA (DUF1232 family)